MSKTEYRIVHSVPDAAAPFYCDSMEEAERLMDAAGEFWLGMKIQTRTVTEWEDA